MKIPESLSRFFLFVGERDWLDSLPDGTTLPEMWKQCRRGDWMLGVVGELAGPVGSASHRRVVGAMSRCARLVLVLFERAHPGDLRPRRAIELGEGYATGGRYDAEAAEAVWAVWAAAGQAEMGDINATTWVARAAGYAVLAAESTAVWAAGEAAEAAARATGTAAAAGEAAQAEMLARCADAVREVYPRCPIAEID